MDKEEREKEKRKEKGGILVISFFCLPREAILTNGSLK
jgi:hypothetical protein